MGVDIMLGPDEYNPCHAQVDTQDPNVVYNDRFYAACQDSNLGRSSYYRHLTYTGGGPQLGAVVFGGADHNRCGGQAWCTNTDGIVMHGWSDKATAWALEFYPGANEGGVRITGRFDQRTLGNFASSGPLGAMRPITDAIPGSFRLAGSVAGGPWPDRRFEVAAFQMPPWTMVTSAYYPEQGFAVIVNSGSTLQSWPMLTGAYKIYVVDHATGASTIVFRNLGPGSRPRPRARAALLRAGGRPRPQHRAAGVLRAGAGHAEGPGGRGAGHAEGAEALTVPPPRHP